jgi:hypothetical protein
VSTFGLYLDLMFASSGDHSGVCFRSLGGYDSFDIFASGKQDRLCTSNVPPAVVLVLLIVWAYRMIRGLVASLLWALGSLPCFFSFGLHLSVGFYFLLSPVCDVLGSFLAFSLLGFFPE